MELPFSVSLERNKEMVQKIIDQYAYARDVNQIALVVYCKDDAGNPFQITQFHSNRKVAHFGSMA